MGERQGCQAGEAGVRKFIGDVAGADHTGIAVHPSSPFIDRFSMRTAIAHPVRHRL